MPMIDFASITYLPAVSYTHLMELVDKNGLTEEEYLKNYRPGDYERPSVTVDMLIFAVDNREESIRPVSYTHL